MKTIMENEILSQSRVLMRTYESNLDLAERLAKVIKSKNIRQIIVAARGSSNNACIYFKYMCEIYAGIPVSFVHPSVVTMYNGKLDMSGCVVLGVSQSGQATDVRAVLDRAQKQGAITVALTNSLTSPMALKTQYHFYLDVDEEKSVTATKTFTAQMLVLNMIVSALISPETKLPYSLKDIPRLIEKTFALRLDIEKLADHLTAQNEILILSRGLNLAVGAEIALKLQETCYVNARNYAISDFYHGSIALAGEGTHFLVLAMEGEAMKDAVEIIKALQPTGADISLLTQDVKLAEKYKASSVLLPPSSEILSPFVSTVAGQMLALLLSARRGIDPDSPRRVRKIILTK